MDKKIRVVIVDDSPSMRALLARIVSASPKLEVVGMAPDAIAARELIMRVNPDVITLDIEMPHMNGLDFLKQLMQHRPTPVIIIAGENPNNPDMLPQSVSLGAFDFLAKPSNPMMITDYADMICEKIVAAAGARHRLKRLTGDVPPAIRKEPLLAPSRFNSNIKLIALGISTGGPEALQIMLPLMPTNLPPVVIVQHMPKNFVPAFVRHLNHDSTVHVRMAEHGAILESGSVYISPGDTHLKIMASSGCLKAQLEPSEPVNRHRPSVDVLFDSVADQVGASAIGVILTGMGKDGAQGLLKMRQGGAMTFGQDQASSVVYGMPREAANIGAVKEVVSLNNVVPRLIEYLSGRR